MNLRLFLAVLIVYQQNFKLLHWCASGSEFHTVHDQAQKYYEKMETDIDNVAEVCMMCNERPLNTKQAYELLENAAGNFLQLDSEADYSKEDFIKYTDVMFGSITRLIEDIIDSDEIDDNHSNIGIKSYLENLHYEYFKEYRYINRRRRG